MRAKHIIEGVSLGVLILVFSLVAFMMTTKNMLFPKFFDYYFLKVHLHMYLKMKSIKEVTKSRNPGFSYFFCLVMEGSGSGRFKNLRIRIHLRIGKKLNIWFGNIRNVAKSLMLTFSHCSLLLVNYL
jgi:hypothetical protein